MSRVIRVAKHGGRFPYDKMSQHRTPHFNRAFFTAPSPAPAPRAPWWRRLLAKLK